MADLQGYHNEIFAPQTVVGTAAAANGGIGGVPVNPVRSGVFVTILPGVQPYLLDQHQSLQWR